MAQDTNVIESEGADLTETRVYELGFHLDGELPQEEVKKAYQGIRDRITAVGTVIAEGEPTKVPLAYTISRQETTGRRDFDTAFFCWIAYEADGAGHDDLPCVVEEGAPLGGGAQVVDQHRDRQALQAARGQPGVSDGAIDLIVARRLL